MRVPFCAWAGVTFINAQLRGVGLSSLRMAGARITALGCEPRPDDVVVDLRGDRLLPGLINAHDHLQLNALPHHEPVTRHRNVRHWISEIAARRVSDPGFEAGVALALDQRLLMGGVKNLLSGVTTVAHHDPLYAFLLAADYPTRVVESYGWSHSLGVDGEAGVQDSHRRTPADRPWMIHAAEGVDAAAGAEFGRLSALGCVGPNTLLIHGIALGTAQRMQLERSGAGLIWCPSSNLRLFGRTAAVADLVQRGRVALGTDSRLSGARDLLEELRIAADISGLDEHTLEGLVTLDGARLLRLPDLGVLRVGARADLLILPAGIRLTAASRTDVRLVVIDGIVRYGDADCARCLEPELPWARVKVDGKPKILDGSIAARLCATAAVEPGLELRDPVGRAA